MLFQSCVAGEKGASGNLGRLKEQATLYVTKLPKEYPPRARRGVVWLVTEEYPLSDAAVFGELSLAQQLEPEGTATPAPLLSPREAPPGTMPHQRPARP